ncbi:MAG: MarC family protein [Bacteroidales bacterium]|nr:MarC family protein [Bacteroidales bacterium]
MQDIILLSTTIFMGFFAIMNPIANTPIFLALTSNIENKSEVNKIAFKAVLYSFIIVSVFCILGQVIFKLFGITLPAFQITGGLLLFVVGYNMLNAKESGIHYPSKEDKEIIKSKIEDPNEEINIAISPLAIPILAGPGTISTAMNFVGAKTSLSTVGHVIIVIAIFALMCSITFILFISGKKIVKFLGHNVIKVISRIMGLILSVIATQMIITGIKNTIPM